MATQLTRDRVTVEETGDLGHIFPSDQVWEAERAALEGAVDALASPGEGLEAPYTVWQRVTTGDLYLDLTRDQAAAYRAAVGAA